MKKNLAIIISSYDECSDMWKNFFKIFFHYWDNCKYNIYLVNNFLQPNFQDIITINTGKEIGWRNRILTALNKIEEEYIMFFHEDYFLGKNVSNNQIEEVLNDIWKNSIKMYRLSKRPKASGKLLNKPYLSPVYENERYGISLQCAIWEKKEFINRINEIDGELPWDFERYFLSKCKNEKRKIIEGYIVDKRDILKLQHGISKGKWLNKTLKYFKKEKIEIDLCGKNKMSFKEEVTNNFKQYLTDILPSNLIIVIKKVLKKIKVNSTTDY